MLHSAQADFSPHSRNAGCIDNDIDKIVFEDQIGIVGYSNLVRFHSSSQVGSSRNLAAMAFFLKSNIHGLECIGNAQFRNSANLDARHMRNACDDISAHFARANQSDANWSPTIRPRLHITRQTCQRHVGCHRFLLNVPAKLSQSPLMHYRLMNICF
ncbi:hypothetical protein D9M69_545240 [compost metagenome]